jgi:hypothetical protein
MYNELILYLKFYKKATISLGELEKLVPGDTTYRSFAEVVKRLVREEILIEKNPDSNNGKEIPLPYKFGVNKYELKKEHINNVQEFTLEAQGEIDLQEYLNLSEEIWNKDLPYIKKINEYIAKRGLPGDFATSQERSFHIMGDEKWIDEKGCKKLLERIKLWDKLKILNAADPLMLAVNPKRFTKSEHHHLIVENKATFMALMEVLPETGCTSLIFGAGWKVTANIIMLQKQLSLEGTHKLYYFGDLDYEGVSIWNSLNERTEAKIAVDFYKELLKKLPSKGKESQLRREKALNNFLKAFNEDEQGKILELLQSGRYLPQEGLTKDELTSIWRSAEWAQV